MVGNGQQELGQEEARTFDVIELAAQALGREGTGA
jgi:hypothetical protein